MSMRTRSGITLIESLITLALIGTLLGMLNIYFVSSTRSSQRTQAQSELAANIRGAAELVVQDLEVAGSRATTSDVIALEATSEIITEVNVISIGCTRNCLLTPSGGVGTLDDLRVRYATSLRGATSSAFSQFFQGFETGGADPCRRVNYFVDPATRSLFRSDVSCAIAADAPILLTGNVVVFNIDYTCGDNSVQLNPTACFSIGSFPRQAEVTVGGSVIYANGKDPVVSEVTLFAVMPNMKE